MSIKENQRFSEESKGQRRVTGSSTFTINKESLSDITNRVSIEAI